MVKILVVHNNNVDQWHICWLQRSVYSYTSQKQNIVIVRTADSRIIET